MNRYLSRRVWLFLLAVSVVISSWILIPAANAQSADRHHIDIPAGDLGKSLTLLGQQAEREVVFPADITRGKQSLALRGDLTTQEALDELLAQSGLTYRLNPSGPIIVEVPNGPLVASGPGAANTPRTPTSRDEPDSKLEEILVTAEKRSERLQEVPVPVSVLSADTLVDSNQLRLEDYFSRVPGLNMTPNVQSSTILSIRGVTTGGATNPTVGVTVDDVRNGDVLAERILGMPREPSSSTAAGRKERGA